MRVHISMRLPVLLGVMALPLCCFGQTSGLSVDQIVSRMDQVRAAERNDNPAYTVTREYQLSSEGAQPSSHVLAQVSYLPPSDKQYVIVKADGNSRGESIVRRVLDHETTMASHWEPYDIAPANYNFALLGRETVNGRDCYVLQLSPKRDAVELVRGKAWVDAKTFDTVRVQGETAKTPSFLIKKLAVTINYGRVNGAWLETSTQAIADVRFAGPHVLRSREVGVQTGTLSARATTPRVERRAHSHVVADTATWVAH